MAAGIEAAGRAAIQPSWVCRITGHIPMPGLCHLGMASPRSRYLCSVQDKGRCSWWHWAHRSPHSRSCAPCRGRWWCGSSGPRSPLGTGTCHGARAVSRRKIKQNFLGWLPQKQPARDLGKELGLVSSCQTLGTGVGGSTACQRMLCCHDNRLRGLSAQGGAAQPSSSPPACQLFSAPNCSLIPRKA